MSRFIIVAAVVACWSGIAIARSEKTVGYSAAKVWPTAVRYLRVDEGVKIVDKDADAGYVVFELTDEGKTYSGSLELVVADDDDGPRVRMVIVINDRPSYMETVMLDRLEKKIRADHGSPPPRKPPAKKPPEPAKPPETEKP